MLVVAYIGFGNSVCRYHLPYVERRKDTIKVKYIYRREEDRVGDEERETWYPDITFTTDINQVMNDEEVNLIVVNTPDQFHVSYTKQALEHGKNVLCEKPFAMTAKEAKEVFDLAKEKGLVAMANQNRRYDADMRTVRKVIESGVLGDIVEFESHYDYYRPSIASRKGFGILYGLAVHPIDQIIGQFGKPKKIVYDCRSIDNPGGCRGVLSAGYSNNKKERERRYLELILTRNERSLQEGDLDQILKILNGIPKKNLSGIHSALLRRFGQEDGGSLYAVLRNHVKIIRAL